MYNDKPVAVVEVGGRRRFRPAIVAAVLTPVLCTTDHSHRQYPRIAITVLETVVIYLDLRVARAGQLRSTWAR